MIEREVISDNSGERTRLACGFWRLAKTNFYDLATLLDVNRQIANRPHKSIAGFFPMKDLSRVERHRQIKIRRRNLHQLHKQTFNVQRSTFNTQYLCESVFICG